LVYAAVGVVPVVSFFAISSHFLSVFVLSSVMGWFRG
jgi:hypothetical protein